MFKYLHCNKKKWTSCLLAAVFLWSFLILNGSSVQAEIDQAADVALTTEAVEPSTSQSEVSTSQSEPPASALEDQGNALELESKPAEEEPSVDRQEPLRVAPESQVKRGWVEEADGRRYYYKPDGSLFKNQMITFGSAVAYYIDEYGACKTGVFRDIDGQVRYADETGLLRLKAGWQEYQGALYYCKGDFGKLFSNQFITFGPQVKYFMNSDGLITHGKFKYDGKVYFADVSTGNLIGTGRWEGDCYVTDQGTTFQNQFITFGSQAKYFMDSDGCITRGKFNYGGKLYFADINTGNLIGPGRWEGDCYVTDQGTTFQNQFITFGSQAKYFMDSDGCITRGKFNYRGKVYFSDLTTGNLIGSARWEGDCYVTSKGTTFQNQFITFGSQVAYYMGASGDRQIGLIIAEDGLSYYAREQAGDSYGQIVLSSPTGKLQVGEQTYVFVNDRGGLWPYRDKAKNIKEEAWDFFRSKGYSPAAVAGLMGNIAAESGWDPGVYEYDSGIGFGLLQWSFNRRDNLKAYADNLGKPWDLPEVQLSFLLHEMEGPESWRFKKRRLPYPSPHDYFGLLGGVAEYKTLTDVKLATEVFCYNFGVPNYSVARLDIRLGYAQEYYRSYYLR